MDLYIKLRRYFSSVERSFLTHYKLPRSVCNVTIDAIIDDVQYDTLNARMCSVLIDFIYENM